MSTSTSNYGWQMPDPGGSANTWGNTLNATTQAIDAQMAIAAQGGVPIGAITMFGGAAAPTNWLLCDGSSLSTAAPYDKLFAAIGYAFGGGGGVFNLPNFTALYPIGADPADGLGVGATGGQFDYALNVANLPPHTHAIVDVAHNHGVNQWAHSHMATAGAITMASTRLSILTKSTLSLEAVLGWRSELAIRFKLFNTGGATTGITSSRGISAFRHANFRCFAQRQRHRPLDHAERRQWRCGGNRHAVSLR